MIATQPIDVVALVQAIFTGLAALLSAIAGIYAIIAANRARRAEVVSLDNSKIIAQVETNTNSMTTRIEAMARKAGVEEGVARGIVTASAVAEGLARGQREGREQNTALSEAVSAKQNAPVAVADDRTAVAAERSAAATERVAAAAEEVPLKTEPAVKAAVKQALDEHDKAK